MAAKKGHKKWGGRKRGTPNATRPVSEQLRNAFDRKMQEADYNKLVEMALAHACGDQIVTESADGQSMTVKLVSDPRLLNSLLPFVATKARDADDKPQTPADSVKAAVAVLKELEELSKPLDPKPRA